MGLVVTKEPEVVYPDDAAPDPNDAGVLAREMLDAINAAIDTSPVAYTSRAAFEAADIDADVPTVTVIDAGILVTLQRETGGSWQSNDGQEWSAIFSSGMGVTENEDDPDGGWWYAGYGDLATYAPNGLGAGSILWNLHTGQPNYVLANVHLSGVYGISYDSMIGLGSGASQLQACHIHGSNHSIIRAPSTHTSLYGGSNIDCTGSYIVGRGTQNTIGVPGTGVTGHAGVTPADYGDISGLANTLESPVAGQVHGRANKNTGNYAHTFGYEAVNNFAAAITWANGKFVAEGDAQSSLLTRKLLTANATPTPMTTLVLPNYTAWKFLILVVAQQLGADQVAGYTIEGVIARGSTAGSTRFVGTPTVTVDGEDDSGWDCGVGVNTGSGGLQIICTGDSAASVQFVALPIFVQTTRAA